MAASPAPIRSATPGLKFCTMTSAAPAMRLNAASPSGCLRSSAMERLLRLLFRNVAEKPPPARCRLPGMVSPAALRP